MSAKHMHETWRIKNLWHVINEQGRLIAGCGGHDSNIPGDNTFEDNQAYARRIVALQNACTSLSTEALEAGVVGEMLEALEKHRYGSQQQPVYGGEVTCCRYCLADWNIYKGTTDCLPDCIISKAKGESP